MADDNESRLRGIGRRVGKGNTSASNFQLLNGINKRTRGNIIAPNQDKQGYVFFTKPCLNLSLDNLIEADKLHYLGSNDSTSMACAIKCMLMPKVSGVNIPELQDVNFTGTRSDHVDDRSPFISVMTNTLNTLNGWPDFIVDYYESPEGVAKEVHGWIDTRPVFRGSFPLTATFANIEGDIVTTMMAAWSEYGARVGENTMRPLSSFISDFSIDYSNRVYVLVMDHTERFVQKIACTGYSLPGAVPDGAAFNYDSSTNMALGNTEITLPIKCFGAVYNSPKIIDWFNRTQQLYNPSMVDGVREATMTRIEARDRLLFNYKGYPRIEDTMELTWWLPNEEYNLLLNNP